MSYNKIQIKCVDCDRTEKFFDVKDAIYKKWLILGYNVGENLPIMRCPFCKKDSIKYPKLNKN